MSLNLNEKTHKQRHLESESHTENLHQGACGVAIVTFMAVKLIVPSFFLGSELVILDRTCSEALKLLQLSLP